MSTGAGYYCVADDILISKAAIFIDNDISPVTLSPESVIRGNGSLLTLLDNDHVSWSMVPARSRCSASMVLMVLSAPANIEKRNLMRQRTSNVTDVQLIFLLGTTDKYQKQLEAEHAKHDDIVQANSVMNAL